MTRKEFDKLWVGSIVHIDNWAWRVLAINRQERRLFVRKMPEVASFGLITRTVGYAEAAYVSTQKPPVGQIYGEEEDRI